MTESITGSKTGTKPGDYDWARHLDTQEKLLWQGRPDQRRTILTPQDPATWAFYLVVLYLMTLEGHIGFSLSDPFGAGRSGLIALLVVILAEWVRLAHDRHGRHEACYAITDRRAMIGRPGRAFEMQQLPLLPDHKVYVEGRFYPTVIFSRASARRRRLRRFFYIDGPPPPIDRRRGGDMLFGVVDDPEHVAEIARAAISGLQTKRMP